jgi:hypothetical protein
MSSRHISLLRSADNFLKTAGILEAPPKMLAETIAWAKSAYCSHILEKLDKMRWANQHREELRDTLVKKIEDPYFLSFADFLLNNSPLQIYKLLSGQRDIQISYFNPTETDKTTDSEGVYEWVNHPETLKIAIRPLDSNKYGEARCNFFLTINYDKTNTKVNHRLMNIPRKEAINTIERYSGVMFEIVDDFRNFVQYFETFSIQQKRNLGFLRAECLKHANPEFGTAYRLKMDFGDSKYFNTKELYQLYTKLTNDWRRPIIYCEFIFDEGRANKLYSESKWSGMWNGSLYIFRSGDARLPSHYEIKDILDDIGETVRHELQHTMQSYIDYIKGLKDKAGLPGRKERSPYRNPHGQYVPSGSANELAPTVRNPDRLPHALRDIEFYPRLADTIAQYKKVINRIPLPARKMFFSVWVAQSDIRDLERLVNQLADKANYHRPYDEWHLRFYAIENVLKREMQQFLLMKNEEPHKYAKAIKLMWKELSAEGLI